MSQSPLLWFLKCLAFAFLGSLLRGFLDSSITPVIKWAIYHNDPTSFLAKTFSPRWYLPLCAPYGLTLGLIPAQQILEAFRSWFGIFSSRISPNIENELDWKRPILWAWVPVGMLFLLRFILWQPLNQSVLSPASASHSRLTYFFGSPDFVWLASSPNPGLWMVDRFGLTGPTFFLLAYTLGVWFRHQLPSLPETHPAETPPDTDPPAIQPSPLIHSIEAENIQRNDAE